MKDGGRRAFLAVLLAGLGLLVVLYGRRSIDEQMTFEQQYPRVNETLYLTLDGEDVVTFDGTGELYSKDIASLLKGANLSKDAVTDIIIGEGITEIGYDAFDGYDALRAIKLGDNVTRVAAGGLKNCPALEYLYYPRDLKDVGLDFLYECKDCRIVTAGRASELPEFTNVRIKKRVFEKVDSLEALQAAAGETRLPVSVSKWWKRDRT